MSGRVVVRAPASSANLGPGFDCLAVALDLWLEVEVEETGEFSLTTDLDVPQDRSNLLVQAFERVTPADRYSFKVKSDIPLSGGLGSSAAAIVAGLKAAALITGTEQGDAELLDQASGAEGHPDNVAAAICGGFVICANGDVERIQVPAGISAVLLVPNESVHTAQARSVLPQQVPLAAAVANIASASALTLALERADLQLLANSLGDQLHQRQRGEQLFPQAYRLLQQAQQFGALGATVSGAGPTVLFWTASSTAAEVEKALQKEADSWAQTLTVQFTNSRTEKI